MRNIFFGSKDVCTFAICICKFPKGTKLSFPQCTTVIQCSQTFKVCEEHFWTVLFFPTKVNGVWLCQTATASSLGLCTFQQK